MLRHLNSACIGKLLWTALFFSLLIPRLLHAADECACLPCDFDLDGDVDMADFGHLQACLTGYGVLQTDPACFDTRLAGHSYVDQQDLAVFRACLTGEQKPYTGSILPPAVISEFISSNDGGLADEDGDHPDWIEIYVPCQPTLDLTGWYLANSTDNLQKWAFPALTLHRGDYLVVFASGKDRRVPGQNLHTNFQLEKNGEYLALVAPDGHTIVHDYSPKFPEQLTNVSYGLAQGSITPVAKGGSTRYYVPTAAEAGLGTAWTAPEFDDQAWSTGPTGLGFSTAPTVFQVTVYRANVAVTNLAAAEAVIADPSKRSSTATGQAATINFLNTGDAGHYSGDQPFPGMNLATNVDQFVTLTTATVVIPSAGEWTFGVNSDEGFSLTLTQGSQVFTSNFPDIRTASDTLRVFKITTPGIYTLRLVHFDQTGGAALELFAAPGNYSAFDSDLFRLVGDVANGGLTLGGLGADVLTNLGPAMKGINSSVWIRAPFTLDDAAFYSGAKLKIRYVDGFAAYLNGEEVCRRNTPSDLTWNSAAATPRTGQLAATTEEITLSGVSGLLRTGQNILAIHGLNDTAADGDFAIVPELILSSNSMQPQYFPTPTPGAPNNVGVLDFVHGVQFDQPHGFRTAPFQLTITCPTPAVDIRYTLDGSTPTATTGTAYAGPITISGTSVVRAGAFKTGWLSSPTMTQTYLFVSDIVLQQPQGQAPSAAWPSGSVNGQTINYGMDPDIVNSATYGPLMDDALLALPALSLVTDLPNLFSTATGIYTHASSDGEAWERPCSLELINPDSSPGFQINAGVRIRGGYSRTGSNPKHAFRLFFRSEYGDTDLDYPLFGAEGVSSFRKVDLRTDQNYSWSFGGDTRNTMTRDLFVRDLQGAMGEPHTRSRSVHLYLDGVYWGIYHFEERAEANFAASYFGGDDNDYDVVKVDAGPYTIYATDGDTNAWYRLWQACGAGFAADADYFKVQGLDVDGTRNPAYEVLVDVDNTIDCAINTYWSGDLDGAISAFLGNNSPNNFYVIRNRDGQSGFKCFRHDCEHTLLDVNEDRTGPFPAGQNFAQFNPQYLSQRLATNTEYKVRFGDRVQKHFFGNGVMTPARTAARFLSWANKLDMAIIAESARWGDAWVNPPRTRADWLNEINWIASSYLPARNDIVLNQLKNDGLYPSVGAPVLSNYGGQVLPGYALGMSKPSGQAGTIYYTTDGTDPRLRGGAVAPTALIYNDSTANTTLISKKSTWRYYNAAHLPDMSWIALDYPETGWSSGGAQLGWGDSDETTLFPSSPASIRNHITYYFRKSFQLPAGTTCTSLTANFLRDDGGAVYINGGAPVASNMPGATWTATTGVTNCISGAAESTYNALTLDPAQVVAGTNVVAAEVHQCASSTSDLSFDLELVATLQSAPFLIDHNMVVKARILSGGQWSALVEAVFITQPVSLVINEFMAENATIIQDPQEPGEYPDWIEIYNPNPIAMDMGGMYLTDDLANPTKFRIANGVGIPANGRLVFWADDDGTQGNLHTNFKLSKDGEQIGLFATDGVTAIDSLTYTAQTTDVSYGRYPDGGSTWGFLQTPTPGDANTPLR